MDIADMLAGTAQPNCNRGDNMESTEVTCELLDCFPEQPPFVFQNNVECSGDRAAAGTSVS